MSQPPAAGDVTRSPWLDRMTSPPWAEIAVLLVAAVVRLWRLSYHSIWFDESVSLKWARSDPGYIWQVTFPLVQDKHPPLYYLLLQYWQRLLEPFGLATSDAALRASGGLLGVLTVAGVMLLASRLAARRSGLLAGLLVALAPLLVWYSQELRMFQPATTAIVWASCALLLADQSADNLRRILWWLLFALCLLAALHTYLFSAFMLPSAGIALLLLAFRSRSWRFLVEGILALAVVTLAFLPLANNAWLVNAGEGAPGTAFAHFAANTVRSLQNFTVWRARWTDAAVNATVALYGLLALTGLVLPYAQPAQSQKLGRFDLDHLWLLVWLLTPFLVANIMLARSASIFDEDRYLLFLAPFTLWAVARGVTAIGTRSRPLGWATAVAAVLPLALALPNLWTPAMARENWRAAAQTIVGYSEASPSLQDAVIAHVDYTHEPLEWYLRQDATFEELPVFFPFGGALTPEQTEDVIAPPLRGLVDFGAHTAWLAQSHLEGVDDQRLVEAWFAENFPVVTELYPAGVKLSAYALHYRYPELPALGDRAEYPDVELAPGIVLAACEVIPEEVAARDKMLHPPSGWVHVRLWWQAQEEVNEDYDTIAQVVGPGGVWGDRLHRDGELQDKWPASRWLAGEYVREELDINLNPVTPPGRYPVVAGLRNPATGEFSRTVFCGDVEIR